jgi:hypothetical protein
MRNGTGDDPRTLQKLVLVAGNLSQYWVLQVPTRWAKIAAPLPLIDQLVRLMVHMRVKESDENQNRLGSLLVSTNGQVQG